MWACWLTLAKVRICVGIQLENPFDSNSMRLFTVIVLLERSSAAAGGFVTVIAFLLCHAAAACCPPRSSHRSVMQNRCATPTATS